MGKLRCKAVRALQGFIGPRMSHPLLGHMPQNQLFRQPNDRWENQIETAWEWWTTEWCSKTRRQHHRLHFAVRNAGQWVLAIRYSERQQQRNPNQETRSRYSAHPRPNGLIAILLYFIRSCFVSLNVNRL